MPLKQPVNIESHKSQMYTHTQNKHMRTRTPTQIPRKPQTDHTHTYWLSWCKSVSDSLSLFLPVFLPFFRFLSPPLFLLVPPPAPCLFQIKFQPVVRRHTSSNPHAESRTPLAEREEEIELRDYIFRVTKSYCCSSQQFATLGKHYHLCESNALYIISLFE